MVRRRKKALCGQTREKKKYNITRKHHSPSSGARKKEDLVETQC